MANFMAFLLILSLCGVLMGAEGEEDFNKTISYFKKVGIEVARFLCNNFDLVVTSLDEDEQI
jgi:hypothetical protein